MWALVFPAFVIAVIANVLLTALLITVIEQRYPEVYEEYNRPSKLFAATGEARFIGEFGVGGSYKLKIEETDFKYVKWVQASLLIALIVFMTQISSLFL